MSKRETLLIRKIWLSMKSRCNKPTDPDYKNYGQRGIAIDPAWYTFETFYRDLGERPPGYRLERLDNDKGYSPSNCKWASPTHQTHNQRLRKDNTSGLKGVTWDRSGSRWFVRGVTKGKYTFLYQGPDFFEACCKRKAWEIRTGIPQAR